ncbi:stage II sporulation protein E [Alkaliphilus peptidifermentans]|uniref:Stage II sporulation protein E n=1 Tax=Alkaliphilus peptidifermentans DSM 18978 TaxID=1120976 RepID=A0A1G5AJC8_9FIRM|nr:stage II sporulation protein E [Alkaliphilus peptidifermentans]SCX77989.1 stage II sporulation protein E [Alkaliphilus peptidifermentans DSM 18978]
MAERSTVYTVEKNVFSFLNQKSFLLLHILGFLMGRAGILDNLTPFGIGFYAAVAYRNKKYATVAITTYLGILSIQGLAVSLPYGIALGIILMLFNYALSLRKTNVFSVSFASSLIYWGISLIFLGFSKFYIYDFMMITFEALVIFAVVYISSYALPITLHRSNRKVLATEEVICVAIIMAVALSGVNEVTILGLSVKNVLGILITIIFAYNGGASIGASVGITLGLISTMSNSGMPPIVIGIYGFSGLLSGIFKDLGKIGSAFGFLLGNTILTFYSNGYHEVFIQLKEVAIAFILFLLIPVVWINELQKYTSPVVGFIHGTRSYGDEIKKRIHGKLTDFSKTFYDLSTTFENMTEQVKLFGNEDITKVVEKVADGVCLDCGMKRTCWDKNFMNTYKGISELLFLIETKEKLDYESIPENIKKKCMYSSKIIEKSIALYELSRIDLTWKKKLMESRELVGEQLKGVSKGIQELALDINDDIQFDTELEDLIYIALDKQGLPVKKLLVTINSKGNTEITIERKNCYGREACIEKYVPVISNVIGNQLIKKNHTCNEYNHNRSCSFTLVEANNFMATTKLAKATKEGNYISGDTYSFMEIKDNYYMIALSDGMGTGEKANRQSSATISMLEKMMEAGFQQEMAIKTINSILMLKSSEEIFSTIDMTLINLQKGIARFAKIGSAPCFIKRDNGDVQTIASTSLPIGILSEIDVQENKRSLNDGDFIIMISDGIIEVNKEIGEQWLYEFLLEATTRNPQELADRILHQALQFAGNRPIDDMTVLVTKVWQTRAQKNLA